MTLYIRPKDGETELRTRFAWFPTRMSSGNIIWLEKYDQHKTYYITDEDVLGYHSIRWVKADET